MQIGKECIDPIAETLQKLKWKTFFFTLSHNRVWYVEIEIQRFIHCLCIYRIWCQSALSWLHWNVQFFFICMSQCLHIGALSSTFKPHLMPKLLQFPFGCLQEWKVPTMLLSKLTLIEFIRSFLPSLLYFFCCCHCLTSSAFYI